MSTFGNKRATSWLKFLLRWGIAAAGITWVLYSLHFRDHIKVITPGMELIDLQVMGSPSEQEAAFQVWGRLPGDARPTEHVIPRREVWTDRSDRAAVELAAEPQGRAYRVVGLRPAWSGDGEFILPKLLIQDPQTKARRIVDPAEVKGPYKAPRYPLLEVGLNRMAREADWKFLLAALLIMPLSYILTSYRWHVLLEAADIHVRLGRALVINMVGAFYNSFMLGSTGGDLVKAYYAAKHTDHRTRAVMSVLVDRAMGLLALIVLGGAMAALQYRQSVDCRRVALASAVLIGATLIGAVVFYHRGLRRATGLAWLLARLPMQRFVHNAVHTLELYGRRPGQMLLALLLCFPVHVTTIASATLAGFAFHLKVPVLYYWVVVPVIALVGAIPISPQGAGVMEVFAVKLLTTRHPVSVGQALALVMSIRLVQIFWNLAAGMFVLRGGYHAPTKAEAEQLESAEDESDETEPPPAPAAPLTATEPSVG